MFKERPPVGTTVDPMSTPYLEKYGALWLDEADTGWSPVYERYSASLELLCVVSRRNGVFRVSVYEKAAHPQWHLPWWFEQRPGALYGKEAEAVKRVELLLKAAGADPEI